MPVVTQLEILDLRHFSARQLRPLLESEADVWQRSLRWNYRGSTELLLQYLDSHILPGFVALDRGRICGFTFCVYEGSKAVVGDAYAVAGDQDQALQITHVLLRHLLDLLLHSPGIDRIESQLLLYNVGTVDDVFRESGFILHPRLFMEFNFEEALPNENTSKFDLPEDVEICRWSAEHYQPAAELIHESYRDHIDSLINDQYCSLHGSLRFLHNIVRFPGCGIFETQHSWVLRDTRTGTLLGMVLCSRVAEDVAHITQFCVSKNWRGHHLGSTLLKHCMGHLSKAGFQAITLTVTEANYQAVKLYEDLGFFRRHRFGAMVFEKPHQSIIDLSSGSEVR